MTFDRDAKLRLVAYPLTFALLSPGLILTLPPTKEGIFFTRETSLPAILTHTAVFGAAAAGIETAIKQGALNEWPKHGFLISKGKDLFRRVSKTEFFE